jgi:uncharacterized protein YjbI with pentapeptide repeats
LKQAKTPKEFVFHRREPELQGEMAVIANAEVLFGRDAVSISDSLIEGLQVEDHTVSSLFVEASVLERVNLSNGSFGSIKLADVRLVNCDLANLEARAISLVRVEFINCRMTGFRAGKLECQDVLISQGDQRYSQFRFSHFKSSEFESCNFEDADFYGTDLSEAGFVDAIFEMRR